MSECLIDVCQKDATHRGYCKNHATMRACFGADLLPGQPDLFATRPDGKPDPAIAQPRPGAELQIDIFGGVADAKKDPKLHLAE